MQAPFFAYFLKDKGTRDFPEALTFEAGANQWRRWEPVAAGEARRDDRRRSTSAPDERARRRMRRRAAERDAASTSYVSDPAHPVPYRQRPIQATYFPGGSKWSTWLVEDQRFVDDRADVLSWETRAARRAT